MSPKNQNHRKLFANNGNDVDNGNEGNVDLNILKSVQVRMKESTKRGLWSYRKDFLKGLKVLIEIMNEDMLPFPVAESSKLLQKVQESEEWILWIQTATDAIHHVFTLLFVGHSVVVSKTTKFKSMLQCGQVIRREEYERC